MSTLFKINSKILKIGNKIVTVSDSPVPPVDYVTIGDQVWKIKNLAIDDGQVGIVTQTVNYGRGDVVEYYYTWDAAVRVAASVPGWHLPSSSEWSTLGNAVGSEISGTKLKSTYGWDDDGNGTDDYGFAVFPAGAREMGSFEDFGIDAYFWTSTSSTTSSGARRCSFSSPGSSLYLETHIDKSICCSVRLIKDSE